jgi:Phage integrase family
MILGSATDRELRFVLQKQPRYPSLKICSADFSAKPLISLMATLDSAQVGLDLEQRVWTIPKSRTKNAKAHVVHLCDQSLAVLKRAQQGPLVFSRGTKPFQEFSRAKRALDQLSGVTGWRLHDLRRTCVSGMARLGVAPHVADKILNHQAGTISGVAAVYQRHEFLAERRAALDLWGAHIGQVLGETSQDRRIDLKIVARSGPPDRLRARL